MAELPEWVKLIDLDAIADPGDKVSECAFFLDLASAQPLKERFRWLVSAFLGAAYSYFEISAMIAFHARPNPETGEPVENIRALAFLRRFVTVVQNVKKPEYVKTGGNHPTTKRLYEFRRKNTHHYPLAIMAAGPTLPEDFHFGNRRGQGEGALAFCREVMKLIEEVEEQYCDLR